MASQPGDGGEFGVEDQWRLLRRQLVHSAGRGFWVGFLFSDVDRDRAELADRARTFLLGTGGRLEVYQIDDLEALGALAGSLGAADPVRLIWVEARRGSSRLARAEWTAAWRSFLSRLNQRRQALAASSTAGLLISGPLDLKLLVAEQAVDLWTVRAFGLELHEDVGLASSGLAGVQRAGLGRCL